MELYDILNGMYVAGSSIPRPFIYGTIGAVLGSGYGAIKREALETCITYGMRTAFLVGASDAFLEIWDKEAIDLYDLLKGLLNGHQNMTGKKTIETLVGGDHITRISETVSRQVPFEASREIAAEIHRLAKYAMKATLDALMLGIPCYTISRKFGK